MQVIILAGGAGTRLRPFTIERPKTLLPVCNVSVLGRLLEQLHAAGFRSAVVSVSPLGMNTAADALCAAPSGFELTVVMAGGQFEGTAASVRSMLAPDADAALVIYGDSLLSVDFAELARAHERTKQRGGLATIVTHRPADLRIAEKDGCTYHGVMCVGKNGQVERFVEKPPINTIGPDDVANAAVFICQRALLESYGDAKDFSKNIFAPAVSEHPPRLYASEIGSGFRLDVGSVGRLVEANFRVLRRELPGLLHATDRGDGVWIADNALHELTNAEQPVLIGNRVTFGPEAVLGPEVVIGDDCRVGGRATLRHSILMESCAIGDGAVIDSCVLGPYCRVEAGAVLPRFSAIGAYGFAGSEHWPV